MPRGAADRELVSGPHVVVHELAGRAVLLALHADPVEPGIRRSGQRVAAAAAAAGPAPAAAGRSGTDRAARQSPPRPGRPGASEITRPALRLDRRHRQRAEPRPRGRRARRGQPGVARPLARRRAGWPARGTTPSQPSDSAGIVSALRTCRAGWPGRYSSASISATVMRSGPPGHPDDLVARADLALAQHPEVKAGPADGRPSSAGIRGVIHPDADPVAGHPRLGDLEERLPIW